jgi:hypothetical protein
MATSASIVCEFCSTLNPGSNETCLACGAPLPRAHQIPDQKASGQNGKPAVQPEVITQPDLAKVRKAGEDLEALSRTALYAYSLFWRTLAEAGSIAMTGFGIGLVGGATGTSALAVPGAVLVGLGVGMSIKMSVLALFSAPLGLLVGALVGAVFYLLGAGVWVFVAFASLGAFLAAFLGGQSIPYRRRNVYEKLRPFIGTTGGLVFGLLGMLVGLGLRAAVNALVR